MFRDVIRETPFTSHKVNNYFESKITGDHLWDGDVSLYSTLCALLYDKLKDDEALHMQLRTNRCDNCNDFIESVSEREALESVEYPTLRFDLYNASGRCNDIFNPELFQNKLPGGFHILNRVTEVFKKYFPIYCFINEESRSVVLIVFNIDLRSLHFIQCAIAGMMPWFFDVKEFDEDRLALLYAMREKTPQKYLQVLNNIINKLDFRSDYIKSALRGFEQSFEKIQLEQMENSIQEYNRNINYKYEEIASLLVELRNLQTNLIGLEQKINSGSEDSEIMEYFLANKHLDLIEARSGKISFIAEDYLTYFDEDEAEIYIKNRNSYFYTPRNHMMNADDFEKVLTEIFLNRTIKIKFCAAYRLNINSLTVNAISGYSYGSEYVNYMPNPHIDSYECIGNFRQIFSECMKNHDYLRAIEQAVVSAKSLNFSDSTVMNKFVNLLLGNATTGAPECDKCLELPDGRMVNVKQAAQWLKEQEGTTNE